MKKLVIFSDESLLAGSLRTGIAEVVDSIANQMQDIYEVTVVTVDGGSVFYRMSSEIVQYSPKIKRCMLFGVRYFLIEPDYFEFLGCSLVNELNPDILHCFAQPRVIDDLWLSSECKKVYTIDSKEAIEDPEKLLNWDILTTVSENYLKELLEEGDSFSDILSEKGCIGITNGILDKVYDPSRGLFIKNKYTAENQMGKFICKEDFTTRYDLPKEKDIYLYAGRFTAAKGLDDIFESVPYINNNNGYLVLIGNGEPFYEETARRMAQRGLLSWVSSWANPLQLVRALPGADIYLSPSLSEPCGLMPMKAARYGCLPIVRSVGGLVDNFKESEAIMFDNYFRDAIDRAIYTLHSGRIGEVRGNLMNMDFSWASRKFKYVSLYEGEN